MGLKIGAVLAGSEEDPCCCIPPMLCCLYPGTPFVDMLYPSTDLPTTIVITIDSGGPYTLTRSLSSPYYSGAGGGFDITVVEGWRVYLNAGTPEEQYFDFDCLISNTFVPGGGSTSTINSTEDEFPSALTGSFDLPFYGNIGFEVERFDGNNCEWRYIDDTRQIYIYYDSVDFKWHYEVILNEADFPDAGGTYTGIKDDPQDSPAGSYSDDGNVTNFVAS